MTISHKQPFLRLIPLLVAITTSPFACECLLAVEESTMSRIERAWRDRQDKTISFRLRWKQRRLLLSSREADSPFDGADRKSQVPVVHDYELLLAVRDGKYRFFSTEPALNGHTGKWIRKESTDVSNGVTAKNYTKRFAREKVRRYFGFSWGDSKSVEDVL